MAAAVGRWMDALQRSDMASEHPGRPGPATPGPGRTGLMKVSIAAPTLDHVVGADDVDHHLARELGFELIVHKNYLVTYRLRADEVQVLQVWHVARERRS